MFWSPEETTHVTVSHKLLPVISRMCRKAPDFVAALTKKKKFFLHFQDIFKCKCTFMMSILFIIINTTCNQFLKYRPKSSKGAGITKPWSDAEEMHV